MDEFNQDPCEIINRNKRKFQDEILEIQVAAKQACLCLERSSTQSNIQLDKTRNNDNPVSEDAVMSVHDDSCNRMPQPHSTSSSSSVNWNGTCFEPKSCEDAISAYTGTSFEDCEFSSSECITKESMEDLFCSNGVVSSNSVLSSGRWNVNRDTEQGSEKLTIDKEFEQYFSMLML